MKRYLIVLTLISLIAIWPFFKKGFYESHDGEWMIIRFTAFHQTLRAGNIPVRFTDRLNNNYGYPVLNYLYPLPFYLSEVPKALGFGFVDSIKILFATSAVFSSLAMFWALSRKFTAQASLAGAILYLFTPYRFVDIYVRGSIGESLSFAILPLILGSLFCIVDGKKIYYPLLAFFIGLLIISHNVIAAIFLPIFFVISFLLVKKEFKRMLVAYPLGILSSAFFWLPALYDLHYVRLSQISVSNIQDHLVPFSRLFIPSWGYGPTPIGHGAFSPQVGLVAITAIFAAIYVRFTSKHKNFVVDFLLAISIISIFLMSRASSFFWNILPFISIIQFPWRLLSVIVFTASYLIAFVIDTNKQKLLLASLIILASIISTVLYTKPVNFVERPDSFYTTNEDSTTVRDEYLPLWAIEKPPGRADQKIVIASGSASILNQKIKPNNYKFMVDAKDNIEVKVNTVFFPGWQVTANGYKKNIDYQNPFGLITFKLPKGTYDVIIQYTRTPVHLLSEIVSLLALLVTLIYFLILKWQRQNF